MSKAKRFKYKIGQSVRFRFYDGSIHDGVIRSSGYRNQDVDYLPTEYSQPMYTCHVPDRTGTYKIGYMVYTVSDNMIKSILDYNITIMPLKDYPTDEPVTISPIERMEEQLDELLGPKPTLEEAIAQQKKFLNR